MNADSLEILVTDTLVALLDGNKPSMVVKLGNKPSEIAELKKVFN